MYANARASIGAAQEEIPRKAFGISYCTLV